MVDLIIPEVVDRMYRDLARPRTPQPQPAHVAAEAKKVELTKTDVNQIIARTRTASPDELQYIIDHAKEFSLTDRERDQLGCDLSIIIAARARQVSGRRDNPSAEFIAKVLGLVETPVGLVSRTWVNAQLQAGSQAIQRCKNHRPPDCLCWAASRAMLWQARVNGEKSPEVWAADRIYSFLEELELVSRLEPGESHL